MRGPTPRLPSSSLSLGSPRGGGETIAWESLLEEERISSSYADVLVSRAADRPHFLTHCLSQSPPLRARFFAFFSERDSLARR